MVAAVAALLVAKAAPCPGAVRAAGERIVSFAAWTRRSCRSRSNWSVLSVRPWAIARSCPWWWC